MIIDQTGQLLGEIAHIIPHSMKAGEPRQVDDPYWTESRRNEPSNLMLLCTACHHLIDGKNSWHKWSAETLRGIKEHHESRYSQAIGRAMSTFGLSVPITSLFPGSKAKNGYALYSREDHEEGLAQGSSEHYDDFLNGLNEFQARIQKTPRIARGVLRAIIFYGEVTADARGDNVEMEVGEPFQHFDMTDEEMRSTLVTLHNKDLIYYFGADQDAYRDPENISTIRPKGYAENFWGFVVGRGGDFMDSMILEADFTVFDAH